MKPRTENTTRKEHGQSLVELAISLTVLLVLLSGAVSFGMALFSYVALRDAAQEGALYGSFEPCVGTTPGECLASDPINVAGIRDRIRTSSTSPIDFSNTSVVPDGYITIVATNDDGAGNPHACEGNVGTAPPVPNALRVSVAYDYQIFMPFVGAIVQNNKIHLTATVTDTILEPQCPP